jgi:DNA-directed RNA polymerase specialized sigma24 family protein
MPDNHSLTAENFQTLLSWLDSNAETAGEKYERIRHRLIHLFIARGCYEAEMLADRTIDRVTSKVPQIGPTFVGEPSVYFYAVANKVHMEWLREQKRERESTFIDLTADPPDDEKEYTCLESCLEKLPRDAREVILEYYRDEKSAKIERRKKLAERLGVSTGALQIRTSRIRARLSDCVGNCVANTKR